jgi:hypothetical protein
MDSLAEDFNNHYISDGGQDLERAEGCWFVIAGVIFSLCTFVLCMLDWTDCFGLKDSCWCLHCGTAGSQKF